MTVFFDTNILVDYLNQVPPARELLLAHPDAAISAIVWIEVMTKDIETPRERLVRGFLGSFHKIELTPAIQERAARIRKTKGLRLPDAIIYATAEEHDAIFVTRNTRDFDSKDPRVVVPYTL